MECCVNGFGTNSRASRTCPHFTSWTVCVVFVVVLSSDYSIDASFVQFFPISTATGSECHDTTFHSAGKLLRIIPSMKDLLSSMSVSVFGPIPNSIQIFMSSRQKYSRISASNSKSCFVALRSVGSMFRSINFAIHRVF